MISSRKKKFPWMERNFTATCCLRRRRRRFAGGASSGKTGRWRATPRRASIRSRARGFSTRCARATCWRRRLIEGQPESYPERLRAAFSADLEFAANLARKLFRGTFLGGAITTRMVQLLNYSPAFRDLIRDVFSGSQDYRSLKRRLWNQLGHHRCGIHAQLS